MTDIDRITERHQPRSDGLPGSCRRCSPWEDIDGGCDAQILLARLAEVEAERDLWCEKAAEQGAEADHWHRLAVAQGWGADR